MARAGGRDHRSRSSRSNHTKISIIIPSYNQAESLEETIKSIVSQEYPNIELIIIDGASKDMSVEVIKKYENYIDYWVSEEDHGIYDAFNKGIKVASGDWLYFIGAGDKLARGNVLDKVLDKCENYDFIYGNVYCDNYTSICGGKFSKWRLTQQNICHQSILYHRKLFETLGPYETKYPIFSDWVFNMRCFGDKIVRTHYSDTFMALYKIGGVSLVEGRNDLAFWKERGKLIRKYLGTSCWIYFEFKLLRKLLHYLSRGDLQIIKWYVGVIFRRSNAL